MSEIDLKQKTVQFIKDVFSDTETAIKETTAPGIVVASNYPDQTPFQKRYEGHEQGVQYVAARKEQIDMGPIAYDDLYADGNTVIGLGVEKSVVRVTGKSFEMPFVHVFRYDDAGKLVELREFNNTQNLAEAFE